MPWGRSSEENFDLVRARQVLDEDHYSLQDIKDRVLVSPVLELPGVVLIGSDVSLVCRSSLPSALSIGRCRGRFSASRDHQVSLPPGYALQ